MRPSGSSILVALWAALGLAAALRAQTASPAPSEVTAEIALRYCCLPEGDGATSLQIVQGYHGEIMIDPATGAVLRLTIEADLNQGLPLVRSDILVDYGPVELGGKTYICPVRSLAIWRSRTVNIFSRIDWNERFRTYGPFSTMLNDMAFDNYHLFRAETRGVTDVPPSEKQ